MINSANNKIILNFSSTDNGGAGSAAYQFHSNLNKAKMNSFLFLVEILFSNVLSTFQKEEIWSETLIRSNVLYSLNDIKNQKTKVINFNVIYG